MGVGYIYGLRVVRDRVDLASAKNSVMPVGGIFFWDAGLGHYVEYLWKISRLALQTDAPHVTCFLRYSSGIPVWDCCLMYLAGILVWGTLTKSGFPLGRLIVRIW